MKKAPKRFLLRKTGAMPTLVVGMSRNAGKLGLMATQAWPWHPRFAGDSGLLEKLSQVTHSKSLLVVMAGVFRWSGIRTERW